MKNLAKMLKELYKRNLINLGLTSEQLKELRDIFNKNQVCAGPFIVGNKKCPNTSALSLVVGKESLLDNQNIRREFNKRGISNFDLKLFYLLYDLPAILSKKLFIRLNFKLKSAVDELINENLSN